MKLEEIFTPGNKVLIDSPIMDARRVAAFFRGHKPDRYIIIENPTVGARSLPFEAAMPCVLRLMHQGRIYGFTSDVLRVVRAPFPLLIMSYPKNIESAQLQKGKHYPIMFDACLATEALMGDFEQRPRQLLLMLSEGGGLFESDSKIELGGGRMLSFNIPEHGLAPDLPVKVLSCVSRDRGFWVEFTFEDQSLPGYKAVRKFLHLLESRQIEDGLMRSSTLGE